MSQSKPFERMRKMSSCSRKGMSGSAITESEIRTISSLDNRKGGDQSLLIFGAMFMMGFPVWQDAAAPQRIVTRKVGCAVQRELGFLDAAAVEGIAAPFHIDASVVELARSGFDRGGIFLQSRCARIAATPADA